MSELFVKKYPIQYKKKHPNADRLAIYYINKAWPVIDQLDKYEIGDTVIHVPPDAMIPKTLADEFGVTNYLSFSKNSDLGRVRAAKIRQEVSFGFLVPANKYDVPEGDLKEYFGITKYEPPERIIGGDQEKDHPLFPHNYDIQNFRNYPDVFQTGELVWITEKIHGTHCKIGRVEGESDFLVGSHRTRRKLGQNSIYEKPLTDKAKECINFIFEKENPLNVILLCEIYGPKIQDLHYGLKEPKWAFFDIIINNSFQNPETSYYYFEKFGLPTAPVLYKGVYESYEQILTYAEGKTTIGGDNPHIREGVVIRPEKERYDESLGRVILKLINNDYLLRKKGTEYH